MWPFLAFSCAILITMALFSTLRQVFYWMAIAAVGIATVRVWMH